MLYHPGSYLEVHEDHRFQVLNSTVAVFPTTPPLQSMLRIIYNYNDYIKISSECNSNYIN